MAFKFSEENLKQIEAIRKKYPTNLPAVMPALYLAQEQAGYITQEAMKEVADVLEIDEENVLGVATFYTMYHLKQPGKFHIQVCTNVSCMLRGGYEIWNSVQEKLGIKNGETTADFKYSLEEVECMGACGGAPMIAVNEDFFENLTKEKALEIIESLK